MQKAADTIAQWKLSGGAVYRVMETERLEGHRQGGGRGGGQAQAGVGTEIGSGGFGAESMV